MLGTKNCGICGHKLSLHQSADSVLVRAAGTSAPTGWYDDGSGRQRWWDGHAWGGFKDAVEEPGTLPSVPRVMQVEPLTVQDSHAKLLQLVELHAQGTLTDDEFREAKKQVLGLQ